MVNATGAGRAHGAGTARPSRFRIEFKILKKGLREHAQVFIVVSRNNAERVCKFMTNQLVFDERRRRRAWSRCGCRR